MIRGNRLLIDKLTLNDAYQMMKWKRAEDILKREYHFLTTRDGDVERWYNNRMDRVDMRSFAVRTHEGKAIGFISIRNISKLFKTATLGITFNMDYLELGYGTESLKLFLNYYFEELQMRVLYLDVASHNKRAINCYKRVGFKQRRRYYAKLEEEYYDLILKEFKENGYSAYSDNFKIVGPFILIVYNKMKITRRSYIQTAKEIEL